MATFEWIYREFSPLLIVYGVLLAATFLARLVVSLRESDIYTVTAPDGRRVDSRLRTSLTREQYAAVFKQTL